MTILSLLLFLFRGPCCKTYNDASLFGKAFTCFVGYLKLIPEEVVNICPSNYVLNSSIKFMLLNFYLCWLLLCIQQVNLML